MKKDLCVKTGLLLGELTHELVCTVSSELKEMEVTPEQPILLDIISNYGPITQKDLADQMHIKPATLTVRLQRLEKKEYIIRTIDQNDKRVQYVEVTDLGKEILKSSKLVMKKVSAFAFKDFDDDEILNFISIINRIQSNLKEFNEK